MAKQLLPGPLYLVCEGEKTEISFYSDLQAELIKAGMASFTQVDFYKVPKPKKDADMLENGEIRAEGGRHVSMIGGIVLPTANYEPLNWIKIAFSKFPAYSETWAVFDNDHRNISPNRSPLIDNAFTEYRKLRQTASNVHIAYSSLSFEYYLLQHFEFLYHEFHKTECYITNRNGKHDYRNCCSKDHKNPPKEGACDGDLGHNCCINGYARRNNRWAESKIEGVLSNVPNIFTGVINSFRIRWRAVSMQRGSKIGDMNPYLNTYNLTLRMMGFQILEYIQDISIPYYDGHITLHLDDNSVIIGNTSTRSYILSEKYMGIYVADNQVILGVTRVGNLTRVDLTNTPEDTIDLTALNTPEFFAILEIEGRKILVCSPCPVNPQFTVEEMAEHTLV